MPFVWRRNGVYQFRRRLSKRLTELGAPASLSLSLQTEVLVEAMKRAAAIVAALERVETEVTTNLVRIFTPAAVTLIVREAARAAPSSGRCSERCSTASLPSSPTRTA